MNCPNCGQPVSPDDAFCGECGTKLSPQSSTTSATSEQSQHQQPTQKHTETPHQSATSEHNSTSTDALHHHSTTNQQHTQSNDQAFNNHHNNQQYGQQQHNQSHHHNGQQAPYGQQSQQNYQQQHNGQQQQPSQLANHAKDVAQESKGFFSGAFISPDHLINNRKVFSYKLLASLLAIGFVVFTLLMAIFIPSEINWLTSKSALVLRLLLTAFAFIAVNILATFGMSKMIIKGRLTFQQVLSDYVLINSVSLALLLSGLLGLAIGTYSFAAFMLMLSLLLFIISGIYLIAKYSGRDQVKFSSYYAIILYLIITFIFAYVVGESLMSSILRSSIDSVKDQIPFYDLLNGSSSQDSDW